MDQHSIEHVARAIGELAERGGELVKDVTLPQDMRRCIAGAFEEVTDAAGGIEAAFRIYREEY